MSDRATVQMPIEDANNLDAVVHELGIEDSFTTPAEAVRELKDRRIAALETENARLRKDAYFMATFLEGITPDLNTQSEDEAAGEDFQLQEVVKKIIAEGGGISGEKIEIENARLRKVEVAARVLMRRCHAVEILQGSYSPSISTHTERTALSAALALQPGEGSGG